MDKIKRAMPFLISGLMILTLFVIRFVVFRMNEAFDVNQFFTNLIVNIFLLVSMALTWMSSGTDRAKREEKSAYRANTVAYGKKIDEITRNGQLNLLRVFCAQKTDEMREKAETATLTRVGIDRAVYADLKALTVAELKKKGYLKRQIRAVRRVAEGRVKVRPIELLELLTDSKGKGDYDVHYDERADKAARTGFRVLKSVVMGAWFALAAPALSQDILNIEVWALFCFQLFTIAWTAWSAEREGYGQIAEVKNKVILRRISFLDEFNEWVKVPKLGEGKGEGEQTREE